MRASDTVRTINGTQVRQSEKAVLFNITAIGERPLKKNRNEWFPFSQVSKMFKDPNAAGQDYIIVSEWILEQKGLLKKELYVQPGDPRDARTESAAEVEQEQSFDPDAEIEPDDIPF